ncbi:hypothetical protein BTM451_08930 [Helicobacter pylori]
MVFTNESEFKKLLASVSQKYLNNKYLNNRDICYCENAICDKKGTYNIEIELVSNTNDFRGVFGEVLDTIDIDNKTKKLESCFRDAIKHPFYCPFTIEDYLILDNLKSCFVFQNKPNVTLFDNDENDRPFNLKQYLLGLKEKLGFELMSIFYCENSNTHKIELIGNDSDFREVLLEFSENIPKAPNEIPQFLTNFKNSKIPNEKISFSPPKDYPSLYKVYGYFKREVRDTFDRYLWHGYSKIPQEKRIAKIKEQVNEEIKINPPFCNYRVDSEQNRKINEIVEGLKSGKIIGKKIISNAFDLNASYCFITLDGLKNLKERLFIDIINVINQKKRVALNHAQIDDIQYKERVALDYALINDIKYNFLDNTFHFIFDIDLHLIDD